MSNTTVRTANGKRVVVPDPKTVAELNEFRHSHSVFRTDLSDIYSMIVNDGNESMTLRQYAMNTMAEHYKANPNSLYSYSLVTQITNTELPKNWKSVAFVDVNRNSRAMFVKAHNLIHLCSTGMWANAQYSNKWAPWGTRGGNENFPIYPADIRHMANGPYTGRDNPGFGYNQALRDIKQAMTQETISTDFHNAAALALFQHGLKVNGEIHQFSSLENIANVVLFVPQYQEYLRAVEEQGSKELRQAAAYFHNLEVSTVAFLANKSETQVRILSQAAALAARVSAVYQGQKTDGSDEYFDKVIFPYTLERLYVALGASSNSLVKSAAGALQVIAELVGLEKYEVAGLERVAGIKNLFLVLSGSSWVGKSESIMLDPSRIEQEIDNRVARGEITFRYGSRTQRFTDAVKKLNRSGLLGTIGFILNITRSVYDTLNLKFAIENGELTTAQVLNLIGRYFGTYSGIGNFFLFVRGLNSVGKKAFLSAANIFNLQEISPRLWGASGTIASDINLPASIELRAFDNAAAEISRHFAELPFAEEDDFINTFFKSEVRAAAEKIPGQTADSLERIVEGSARQVARDIETVSEGLVSYSRGLLAAKAFNASLLMAGVIGDALFLAAAIVNIAESSDPTDQQIIDLSASVLSMGGSIIGVGIAVGFLESVVFPPIAIGLTIGAVVLGIVSGIISIIEGQKSIRETRSNMENRFRQLQEHGYLHDWGEKIQFLAAYYDNTYYPRDGRPRLQPGEVSIFEAESAAWHAFSQATGDTFSRFLDHAVPNLVHVKPLLPGV